MWLIIRESDDAVVGTNYNIAPPVPVDHRVVEWAGPEPPIHDPDEGIFSYDPTLTDPDYATFMAAKAAFDAMEAQAAAEIAWLEATIPTIGVAGLAEARTVLERLAEQNLLSIRAWRYLWRCLG